LNSAIEESKMTIKVALSFAFHSSLVGLGLFIAGGVSSAWAADPLPVQEVSEPTKHPYQSTTFSECDNLGACNVVFPAITTARTVVLNASCGFRLQDSAYLTTVLLTDNDARDITSYLPIQKIGDQNSVSVFIVSGPTYHFFEKGQQPDILLDVSGAYSGPGPVQCTVAGYYL
jgi:hypothetical protein